MANGTEPNYGVILVNDTSVIAGIKASEYSQYARPYLSIIYSDAAQLCPNLYGAGLVDFGDFAIWVMTGVWLAAILLPTLITTARLTSATSASSAIIGCTTAHSKN